LSHKNQPLLEKSISYSFPDSHYSNRIVLGRNNENARPSAARAAAGGPSPLVPQNQVPTIQEESYSGRNIPNPSPPFPTKIKPCMKKQNQTPTIQAGLYWGETFPVLLPLVPQNQTLLEQTPTIQAGSIRGETLEEWRDRRLRTAPQAPTSPPSNKINSA